MKIRNADDLQAQSKKQSDFYNAISGKHEECIVNATPRTIKFMASEVNQLGEKFILKAFERHACVDDHDSKNR